MIGATLFLHNILFFQSVYLSLPKKFGLFILWTFSFKSPFNHVCVDSLKYGMRLFIKKRWREDETAKNILFFFLLFSRAPSSDYNTHVFLNGIVKLTKMTNQLHNYLYNLFSLRGSNMLQGHSSGLPFSQEKV